MCRLNYIPQVIKHTKLVFSAILLSFARGSGWDQLLRVITQLLAGYLRPGHDFYFFLLFCLVLNSHWTFTPMLRGPQDCAWMKWYWARLVLKKKNVTLPWVYTEPQHTLVQLCTLILECTWCGSVHTTEPNIMHFSLIGCFSGAKWFSPLRNRCHTGSDKFNQCSSYMANGLMKPMQYEVHTKCDRRVRFGFCQWVSGLLVSWGYTPNHSGYKENSSLLEDFWGLTSHLQSNEDTIQSRYGYYYYYNY